MRKLVVADSVHTAGGIAGNAVLIEKGAVLAVGSHNELGAGSLHEERYPGATIVAGLRDAHIHPVSYAALLAGTQLMDASDLHEVKARLRVAADASPGPVIAMRLDDESLAEGRLPTRRDLDAAVADRPVLVHRYCGHVAIGNSAALALAGVDAGTCDPAGGTIDRDPDGVPNGVLRETAIELVSTKLKGAAAVSGDDLLAALRGLAGLGITSIGAMLGLGDGPWASLGDEVSLFAEISRALPIRVHAFVITADPVELDDAAGRLDGAVGRRLRWAGVKRFADGSLGGHTAAMYESFADRPDTGTMRLTDADRAVARHAIAAGGIAAIHAIGDRAASSVLDLFEEMVLEGADPRRMRLEHASVLTRDDIARIGRLGIVVCVQPAFLGSEWQWLEKRVGRSRLATTYPFAALEETGAILAGGSDCPVESPDPLSGIALARDRAGIVPAESLSAERALEMFTTGGAAALGELVPWSPGSAADLAVLDVNPVLATPDEVRAATVIDTYVDGEPVDVDRSLSTWPE